MTARTAFFRNSRRRRAGVWKRLLLLLGAGLLPALQPLCAQSRFAYEQIPLRQVIRDIEDRSTYRFLYRDALVTDKTVTLQAAEGELFSSLTHALRPQGIGLRVDSLRSQVLLFPAEAPGEAGVLSGQVVDAQSGARLPYATVTWRRDGHLQGVTTDESGTFRLSLASAAARPPLDLTVSYLGYRAERIHVASAGPAELSVRLTPDPVAGQEVVVTGSVFHSGLDTTWHHLLRPDRYAPFGERSVVRALQPLPAVGLTPALGEGLHVRGSKTDGFQVLLDGVPIYNQNHLFGLFDAFNDDALQAVGFYYDVAPATLFAPPGGTLSFLTRTGSQTRRGTSVGLTNTALRGTAEGPLRAGRGSWLVSGRHSYLNALDWLGNGALIAYGLDVGRPTSPLPSPFQEVEARTVFPGASAARFYDLHAKLYDESGGGRRLMLTGYLGGNRTRQEAERFMVAVLSDTTQRRAALHDVVTANAWDNAAAGIHYQHTLGRSASSRLLLAVSRYTGRFEKDDFVYKQPDRPVLVPVLAPFAYRSELTQIKLSHQIDLAARHRGTWSLGYALDGFDLAYRERAIARENDFVREQTYEEQRRALQTDLFAQYDVETDAAEVHLGVRTHLFSQGPFLRLSPRLRFRFRPRSRASLGLGYSRNHQFLHRLYFTHTNSANVWVLTGPGQPPTEADHLTAGLYLKASRATFLQIEGYRKTSRNLRQHEINALHRRHLETVSRKAPWFFDYTAYARGLEVLLRQGLGPARWTAAYTLSRTELQNDALLEGARFRADWDRTHQVTTSLEIPLRASLHAHLAWLLASGTPNPLAYNTPAEPAVLPPYHRLDAGLRFARAFGSAAVEAGISVFNLYDRSNTWYREPVTVVRPGPELEFVNVDVYDLGLQPSFDLLIAF